ncbi:Ceramide kinase [Gryllus bimaculatus]|nr:Ceramide kinase [Gryllus bimaculatus]
MLKDKRALLLSRDAWNTNYGLCNKRGNLQEKQTELCVEASGAYRPRPYPRSTLPLADVVAVNYVHEQDRSLCCGFQGLDDEGKPLSADLASTPPPRHHAFVLHYAAPTTKNRWRLQTVTLNHTDPRQIASWVKTIRNYLAVRIYRACMACGITEAGQGRPASGAEEVVKERPVSVVRQPLTFAAKSIGRPQKDSKRAWNRPLSQVAFLTIRVYVSQTARTPPPSVPVPLAIPISTLSPSPAPTQGWADSNLTLQVVAF